MLHNGPNASQELDEISVLLPSLDKYAFDLGRLLKTSSVEISFIFSLAMFK